MLFDKNNLNTKIISGGEIFGLSSETPKTSNTKKTLSIAEIFKHLTKKSDTQTTSDKTQNTKLPEKSDSNINFFETSANKLSSGRHALNNLLGSKIFVKENEQNGQVNLLNLCNNLKKLEEVINNLFIAMYGVNIIKKLGVTYFERCHEKEYYEIKLLLFALLHVGKNAIIIENVDFDKIELLTKNVDNLKMILNIGGEHWVSIISSSGLNGQHDYYDSYQMLILNFKNRTDLYNYIKEKKVTTSQAILLKENINIGYTKSNDSDNLVSHALVSEFKIRYNKINNVSTSNLDDNKMKQLLQATNAAYNTLFTSYRAQSLPVKVPPHITSTTSSTPSTDFMIKHEGTIYAIGDIHGDIIPLIICLRDCCRVIKKKENFYFNQNEIDNDLNKEMNKSWDDKTFVDDLNYEWCGGNAYVVFCGDILDNVRHGDEKKPGEFPFEEARIFKFINAINSQAMGSNGRLFKVLGNHDMANLNGDNAYSSYISKFAKEYDGYKSGTTSGRLDYFGKGKPGAELIGKDGAFLFLMINNFIFVHGGINTELLKINNIKKVNESLMKYIYNKDTSIDFSFGKKSIESQITFGKNDGLTLDRYFGHYKNRKSDTEMCDRLHTQFSKFINSIKSDDKYKNIYSYNPDTMKLVIGHCTQVKEQRKEMYTTMFTERIPREGKDDVNFNEEFGGKVSIHDPSKNIYGITVSCGKRKANGNMNLDDPTLIRLDIAMSRGFNSDYFRYFDESRTSQVLKIKNGKVTVVKSSVKNRNVHLTEQTTTYRTTTYRKKKNTYEKYEKYKSKYLKLKDEINNI